MMLWCRWCISDGLRIEKYNSSSNRSMSSTPSSPRLCPASWSTWPSPLSSSWTRAPWWPASPAWCWGCFSPSARDSWTWRRCSGSRALTRLSSGASWSSCSWSPQWLWPGWRLTSGQWGHGLWCWWHTRRDTWAATSATWSPVTRYKPIPAPRDDMLSVWIHTLSHAPDGRCIQDTGAWLKVWSQRLQINCPVTTESGWWHSDEC